ncbi:PEFG-CTERM domain-containing protein [Nitrosopumilus cobalaminigenes]|uniref:PEFG-CTERM domain-containing protein n=1 Tax=Nitrosopumilus cobalaminigenes TaxID=1470066 RepID=A0A7D5M004_9ARCH|nr:PEFG-CTERM sorting domain-containing protein [Nitrosopumilus cobalaminigenes]QLH03594.1 PEFG-CTERM domain-containing protein [Nitrosopumilus cobalaminigenes]
MKTKAISSFFVLFAIASVIAISAPDAFADHSEVTVEAAQGSGAPGCEETAEGCYIPSTATVDVGGVVIFSNPDSAAHTFTSGDPTMPETVQVLFDSGLVMAGSTYEWSPTETGEVDYFCMVHPWMQGVIIVQEVGAAEEDDHGDDHGDEMMMPTGAASATGMLSDGTKVSVWTTAPTKGEMLEISVQFEGAEHVNHDMKVTQNGNTVLDDKAAHHHDGKGVHMTKALGSSDPVNITITFQGYGVDNPKTGPIGEKVVFSNVVPEFGTIAMMILAVAIISIVAVTAKSRVVPRF